jgi:hypothetical protein
MNIEDHLYQAQAALSFLGHITCYYNDLLLRKTGENGHTIALVYPEESGDCIRGYVAGQIDALRLALDHVRDIAARQ